MKDSNLHCCFQKLGCSSHYLNSGAQMWPFQPSHSTGLSRDQKLQPEHRGTLVSPHSPPYTAIEHAGNQLPEKPSGTGSRGKQRAKKSHQVSLNMLLRLQKDARWAATCPTLHKASPAAAKGVICTRCLCNLIRLSWASDCLKTLAAGFDTITCTKSCDPSLA